MDDDEDEEEYVTKATCGGWELGGTSGCEAICLMQPRALTQSHAVNWESTGESLANEWSH